MSHNLELITCCSCKKLDSLVTAAHTAITGSYLAFSSCTWQFTSRRVPASGETLTVKKRRNIKGLGEFSDECDKSFQVSYGLELHEELG